MEHVGVGLVKWQIEVEHVRIVCGRATNGADKYVDGWVTITGEEPCVRFWLNPSESLDVTRRLLRCGGGWSVVLREAARVGNAWLFSHQA